MKTKRYVSLQIFCLILFAGAAVASTGCGTMNKFFGGGLGSAGIVGDSCSSGST